MLERVFFVHLQSILFLWVVLEILILVVERVGVMDLKN